MIAMVLALATYGNSHPWMCIPTVNAMTMHTLMSKDKENYVHAASTEQTRGEGITSMPTTKPMYRHQRKTQADR